MRKMIKRKEWLGDIPSNWDYIPGKYAFKLRTSKGNSTPVLLAATQKQGMYPQHLLEGVVQVQEGTDMQTFRTVHINDYVISLRSFQGGFEMSDYEGVCSPAYQVFYNTKPIDHRYFKYLFKCKGFIQEMDSVTVGIREGKNIPYNSFGQTYIPFPPLSEQSRIAAFLDERCGKIDEAIAKHKALIEKLDEYRKAVITKAVTKGVRGKREMKESGIDWIGKIPVEWSLNRIGNLIHSYKAGPFGSSLITSRLLDSGKYLVYTPEHVTEKDTCIDGNLYLPDERLEEMSQFLVYPGDVVFTIVGSLGKSMVIRDSMPIGIINQRLAKFRIKNNTVNTDYFMCVFSSDFYKQYIEYHKRGSVIVNLTKAIVKVMPFPLPPIAEQSEIVTYLDEKCIAIDGAKERHQQLIAKLEEYKKSLIYNAVTGKIEC